MKFSIIVDVYNCENYIKKSIDSVLNQSINFEENVQLIIIDKDSSDKTLDILYEYQNSYPNNILIFTKEFFKESYNLSQVYDYITGEYVTFLSNKDHFTKNTLKDISMFLKNNPSENVVSIPINNPSNKNDMELNNKFNNIPDSGDSIEITEKLDFIQNFLISNFIKFDTLKRFDFDLNNKFNSVEGTFLINKILAEENKIGLIKTSKYFKIDSQSYIYTTPKDFEKEFFISNLNFYYSNIINYFKNRYGHVPHFIQNMIAYNLSKVVQHNYNFLNKKEEEKLFTYLYNILLNIDSNIIIQNDFIQRPIKSFLTYIKNNQQSFINIENNQLDLKSKNFLIDRLSYHPIYLTYKKIEDNIFTLRGMYNSHFNSDYLTFEAIIENENGDTEVVEGLKLDYVQKEKKISYNLNKPWEYTNYFEFNIKFKDDNNKKIYFRTKYNDLKNNYEYLPKIEYAYKSGISEEKNIIYSETNKISFEKEFIGIENSYLFSIIMAIYNTSNYLDESILSVINQSLNFEKYTQLILVNDGSTDNSLEICKEYQAQYPNNIILINQQNAGQSTARNNGLKHAKGRYVNFLDSDDYLSEDTLKLVYDFINKHENETDVIAIPLTPFGRSHDEHKLNYKFNQTRVINLEKEPDNPQLSASSSFIKLEALGDNRFDAKLISSEDAHLVNQVLLNKKTLGVLNNAYYYYRKRYDTSSTIDTMTFQKEHYTDRLKHHFMKIINQCIEKEGKVPKFIQYALIYDIHWLVKETETLDIFKNEFERKEFLFYIKKIFGFFDDDVIFKNKNINDYGLQLFCYYLKKQDLHFELTKNDVKLKISNKIIDNMGCHPLYIDIIKIQNGFLNISGFINSLIDYNFTSILAVKENENGSVEYYPSKQVTYTSRKNKQYLDIIWLYKKNFDIQIPLKNIFNSKIRLKFNFHKNGDNSNFKKENIISIDSNIKFNKHSKFSETIGFLVKKQYILLYENKTFTIIPYTYKKLYSLEKEVWKKLKEEKPYGYKEALKVRKLYTYLYPLVNRIKRDKEIYLFMDRKEIADDNSMHLFKYANTVDDNVKKYLTVSNKSRNYTSLSKIGNVINYNSLKHKLIYIFADKIISTHPYESELNPFFEYGDDRRELFNGLNVSKVYFLQHGVTKDNISDWMGKFNHDLSLIVTVSDEERESFFVEGYGFDKEIIQTLGFPRYDNLNNKNDSKHILIIPTWRKYLRGNKELFVNSDYYKSLNGLLNNKTLISIAKEKGYTIIFKAHPELEKNINETDELYIDLFDIPDEVNLSTEESYQELFNKSSLLITDYSSVFFDFAYMKKPVIYYHPNDNYHYMNSYFDYETMGFGEIIKDENDLVNLIMEYMNNDCNMKKKYIERVENFFKYTDKNNCKRVYNWIKKN